MWNACHGFMAIWSDVAPSDFDFYHRWLLKEHFPERVGIPGFISARVFRRQAGPDFQFFIIYETESPEVLASPAYRGQTQQPNADDAKGNAEAEELRPRRRPCRSIKRGLRRRGGKGLAIC